MCLFWRVGVFNAGAFRRLKEITGCHEISFERRNRSRENVSTVKMKGVNLYQAVCSGITMPWAQVNVGR